MSNPRVPWNPVVVDGEVVVDRELTDAERLDRIELILNDLSADLVAHGGAHVRNRAPVRHLLLSRGWLRRG
jgi:hypothetical protein